MSDDRQESVSDDELESQEGAELPDREVMSVITPSPEGDVIPVEGDPGDYW